ncbi:MAG: regulatory protein GemA [Candidatus Omnitrophica bacterium]|nr:regulatory protein GemA [Candidatus Omnitrophota bacterium]
MKYIDHKKLAVIHIVKKELQLSNDEYRHLLHEITGVHSAKDLTNIKFKKLMYYFVRSKHYRTKPNSITIRQKLYIHHMLKMAEWDKQHMTNFIKKYYNAPKIESLSKKNASKFIEALKHMITPKHQ